MSDEDSDVEFLYERQRKRVLVRETWTLFVPTPLIPAPEYREENGTIIIDSEDEVINTSIIIDFMIHCDLQVLDFTNLSDGEDANKKVQQSASNAQGVQLDGANGALVSRLHDFADIVRRETTRDQTAMRRFERVESNKRRRISALPLSIPTTIGPFWKTIVRYPAGLFESAKIRDLSSFFP
jgi:hypothetical protein